MYETHRVKSVVASKTNFEGKKFVISIVRSMRRKWFLTFWNFYRNPPILKWYHFNARNCQSNDKEEKREEGRDGEKNWNSNCSFSIEVKDEEGVDLMDSIIFIFIRFCFVSLLFQCQSICRINTRSPVYTSRRQSALNRSQLI